MDPAKCSKWQSSSMWLYKILIELFKGSGGLDTQWMAVTLMIECEICHELSDCNDVEKSD